ncbi:MAG: T9SS type A sorting domain-containing protein, partial [Dyadobacter sp.]|uniref:T9SS type A sorting domain-containing protein n=1 Tax=Dyadobacter sp. TaxID=1914288 RepID=UPI001B2656A4
HLGANAGSDGTVNGILPNITVTTTDVTNANFGVQQPPVTTDEALPSSPNPGGTVTVDISDDFNFTDPDGTVETITFTAFPDSVTTVTINGTTYVAPGQTPGAGQQVFPDSGVTVPVANLEVLIDPIDGNPTVEVPFIVTDNGGLESNESSVTKPFTTPQVHLSGNVFHDANALTDSTVNTTGSVTTIPTGLFVTLVDSTGAAVATVPVNADGSYDFGNVAPGTYSVVLHQTAAGSTTPSLPTGWINTGEHLGANAGSDGTVNGILPNITVTTTDVTNANFGVQQPPVADPKEYLIDQPITDAIIPLNGSHTSTGTGTSSPDQLTGADPEDGTLNGSGKDRTVVITTLPDNGELYYNGVLVTPGQVIPNYNPDSLAIKLTGAGYTSTTFEYAYVDEAGVQSPPATYTISWEKPLPVTLVSFTATARENAAELNWATSEETNSDRFEIQRSTDGKTWKQIGSVKAEGESKVRKNYVHIDHQPEVGATNLYRLRMLDLDGTFAFSAIRSVRFDSKLESSIYPNPVSNELTLKVTSWKQVKSIRINNLAGLEVYSSGAADSGKVDVSKLDAGVYVLRITHTDGSVHTHKFVHVK